MEIGVETIAGVAVATIPVQELDAANSAELKRDIAPVLEASSRVVIDLGRLRFIDSSGLGALLSCLRSVASKGGELKLCGMSNQVQAAFELVRLHRIFDVHPTAALAVSAFASPPTSG
jgi:anti-sigma B factor antagonist